MYIQCVPRNVLIEQTTRPLPLLSWGLPSVTDGHQITRYSSMDIDITELRQNNMRMSSLHGCGRDHIRTELGVLVTGFTVEAEDGTFLCAFEK